MMVDLELSVLQPARDGLGFIAAFAVTDQLILAGGGTSSDGPLVLASSNARHFEVRRPPRELGLRDVLAVGDELWTCGEYGQVAVSRDGGATWKQLETGTEQCLFGLAHTSDGTVWVVGDDGFAARVHGETVERLDFQTSARLASVHVVEDTVVALGADGNVYRWRDGDVIKMGTGSQQPLTGLLVTKNGTWIVIGDGGFIARSPDGAWFSRVRANVEIDLEAIAACESGVIVCVGDRGLVLISRDDGRTWRQLPTELATHLWSVERFGHGVLIGGDGGFIARLAPTDDATWTDRINVFAAARPLDPVFAAGPKGFIGNGLAAYLASVANVEPHGVDDDDDEGDDTFPPLAKAGTAADFEANYGVPLPADAARFFELVRGADRWSTFEELRLDNELLPDVGDANLFELLVRRDQQAYLGTGLVEAFCGVFCIGSLDNGDTYHMEAYEWDGGRQVLHYDHDDHTFTGVFADSLDSLAYFTALRRAHEHRSISDETYAIGLRKLRGKIAPTWHFSIKDDDPDFVMLDAKRRDSEFFFYRSRWIMALLENDGVTDIDDIPRLFNADFNQVVPQDQLPARFEACEKFIPTALYSMWRAFLFDEPELGRYLDIARRHRARLVRDAAMLIDELRGGRNELGSIADVRAHLARFRALDLDPRRADARKAEAEARSKLEASRRQEIEEELARTPRSSWADLAWTWLDDGVAHRALLAKLDTLPDTARQIAALDELRELTDEEREIMLPRLANELGGELEAILVGSLVRGDALEGVLARPGLAETAPDDDGDDELDDDLDDDDLDDDDEDDVDLDHEAAGDEDAAPGWDAIDRALEPIYEGAEPHAHFGTVLPYALGGNDPLHGISVYLRTEPVPHFHFVTYGFTDLFAKETDDPDESGFGFELTLRLARAASDVEVPTWALNFLQNLARYVFGTGNRFGAGHKMGLNGPIATEHATRLTAILFTEDPELGEIESDFGAARFLQVVGITDDEYKLIQEWSTTGLVDVLRQKLPLLVTDLARASVLDDAAIVAEVKRRVAAEGSSEDLTFAGDMALTVDEGTLRIEMGALYASALPRAMRGRLRHGRTYTMRGRNAELRLRPGREVAYTAGDGELELVLSPELVDELERQLQDGLAGEYRFEAWPALSITVTSTIIRDQAGRAVDVRGIASAEEARQILEEENAVLDAEEDDDEDEDEGEDDHDHDHDDHDHEHDDHDHDGDDDAHARAHRLGLPHTHDDDHDDAPDLTGDDTPPPSQDRIMAALAMTRRALRLAPDDDDAQFTHAMLQLDADRAGMTGHIDELLQALPRYTTSNQLNILARLGQRGHARFADALDVVLVTGQLASHGDVAEELFAQLGGAVLAHAPDRFGTLASVVPGRVNLLASLAYKAIQAGHRDQARALYERLLELPIPDEGDERTNYLMAMNNACVQASEAKDYETAVRIADRAQSYAHENPYLYHSAACAYAAVGAYQKALEQVKHAVDSDYDHLAKLEVDTDLGELLGWPQFKALFRDWHARKEGN